MGKLPDSLRKTFNKLNRLKARLKHQISKCEEDLNRDLAKLKGSVKRQVSEGVIKDATGDRTMKRIHNTVRDEISKIHDAICLL